MVEFGERGDFSEVDPLREVICRASVELELSLMSLAAGDLDLASALLGVVLVDLGLFLVGVVCSDLGALVGVVLSGLGGEGDMTVDL